MSITINYDRLRREGRWRILKLLDVARPLGASFELLWRALTDQSLPLTLDDVRRELVYLRGHGLVSIANEERGDWVASLTAHGVDVVEYSAPPPTGIDRPAKVF